MAYNAARVLPRQIEALLQQRRALQEIIVVDNASTDGTGAMLAERYPQVTVLRMKENSGAAGAWARGLAYAALEKSHEWVWSLDDDSVPATDVLVRLLEGIDSLNAAQAEVGMVVPMPVHRGTGICYPPFLWRNGFVKATAEQVNQPIWFADMAIASGSLVRREVVRKIGLYCPATESPDTTTCVRGYICFSTTQRPRCKQWRNSCSKGGHHPK